MSRQETVSLQENGRHKLTHADSLLGAATRRAKNSYKEKLKYAKKLSKIALEEKWYELLKTALTSPVMSGVIAYGGVAAVEQLTNAWYNSTASQNSTSTPGGQPPIPPGVTQAKNTWLSFVNSLLPPGLQNLIQFKQSSQGGLSLGTATGPGSALGPNPLALDFIALKGVILIYIASGGNLAGLLQSSGNALSGILSGLGGVLAPEAGAASSVLAGGAFSGL